MRARTLAVSLLSPEALEGFIRGLRDRHPGQVVLLAGLYSEDGAASGGVGDEVLSWRSQQPRDLVRDLRRRRFSRAVLAHSRDQHATRAYWKGIALVLASGAKQKVFLELESRSERGIVGAVVAGALSVSLEVLGRFSVAALGALLFTIVTAAVAVTDASEVLVGREVPSRSAKRGRKR
jgi:hypothetical protein